VTITLNGTCVEIADGTTVASIIESYAEEGRIPGSALGVAVAVNGEVVERVRWSDVQLSPDDRVEVLQAIGGG
jgi:sulfur carrier protein